MGPNRPHAWAWQDEAAGRLKRAIFPTDLGIEASRTRPPAPPPWSWATGIGRPLTIRQGVGSELLVRPDRAAGTVDMRTGVSSKSRTFRVRTTASRSKAVAAIRASGVSKVLPRSRACARHSPASRAVGGPAWTYSRYKSSASIAGSPSVRRPAHISATVTLVTIGSSPTTYIDSSRAIADGTARRWSMRNVELSTNLTTQVVRPRVAGVPPTGADPLDDRLVGREEGMICPDTSARLDRRVPAVAPDLAGQHLSHVSAPSAWTGHLIDGLDQILGQHQVNRAHIHAHTVSTRARSGPAHSRSPPATPARPPYHP